MPRWIYSVIEDDFMYGQILVCERDQVEVLMAKRLEKLAKQVNRSRPSLGLPLMDVSRCKFADLTELIPSKL